jgi:hypothetical protein
VQGKDGSSQRRKLTTGKSNDNYLEVENGIEEGELVLLYNPLLPTGKGAGKRDAEREATTEGGAKSATPDADAKPGAPATPAAASTTPGPAAQKAGT